MCQRLSFYIQPAGYLNQWSPDFYDYSAQRIPQRPDRSSPFCNNPSYDVPEVDGIRLFMYIFFPYPIIGYILPVFSFHTFLLTT
jgi:hypothetical protein